MRERIAIGVSLLAVMLLVTLAAFFAASQNRPDSRAPAAAMLLDGPTPADESDSAVPEPLDAEFGETVQQTDSVRGRSVFQKANCERCHSVEGIGSRRYPLDGVGLRLNRAQLRAWTIAEGAVQDSLSPSAVRAKQRYADLPSTEMEALLDYMSKLVVEP